MVQQVEGVSVALYVLQGHGGTAHQSPGRVFIPGSSPQAGVARAASAVLTGSQGSGRSGAKATGALWVTDVGPSVQNECQVGGAGRGETERERTQV